MGHKIIYADEGVGAAGALQQWTASQGYTWSAVTADSYVGTMHLMLMMASGPPERSQPRQPPKAGPSLGSQILARAVTAARTSMWAPYT